jgi:hypothetical protein
VCCDYGLKMALTRLDAKTLEELEELRVRSQHLVKLSL